MIDLKLYYRTLLKAYRKILQKKLCATLLQMALFTQIYSFECYTLSNTNLSRICNFSALPQSYKTSRQDALTFNSSVLTFFLILITF